MRHTPESIKRRIMSEEIEVVYALRAIARINGFGCGGAKFGHSLVEWCETRRLTEKQLIAARNMICGNYLAVLATAANAKNDETPTREEEVYDQEEKDYRDGWAAQERNNEPSPSGQWEPDF